MMRNSKPHKNIIHLQIDEKFIATKQECVRYTVICIHDLCTDCRVSFRCRGSRGAIQLRELRTAQQQGMYTLYAFMSDLFAYQCLCVWSHFSVHEFVHFFEVRVVILFCTATRAHTLQIHACMQSGIDVRLQNISCIVAW